MPLMFYERRLCDMTDLDCKQTEKLIPQFLKDELDNRTEKKFLIMWMDAVPALRS